MRKCEIWRMGKLKLIKKLASKAGGAARRILGSKTGRKIGGVVKASSIGRGIKKAMPTIKKVGGKLLKTAGRAGAVGAIGLAAGAVGLGVAAVRGVRKVRERIQERRGEGVRTRRSAVPKVVTKYFTKLERKEKKINKILSTIVNKTTAGKLMKQRMKKGGGSTGIITKDEALAALRK